MKGIKILKTNYTLEDFDYNLPHELIAQTPIKDRDESVSWF